MLFKWWNAKQVHRFYIQLDSVCFTVNTKLGKFYNKIIYYIIPSPIFFLTLKFETTQWNKTSLISSLKELLVFKI